MRKTNLNGMPHGAGTMQLRGLSYWITYRHADGATVQENVHSNDPAAARILLAQRTLERLDCFAAELRAVIDENTAALAGNGRTRDAESAGTRRASGTRGMGRRAQAANRARTEVKA